MSNGQLEGDGFSVPQVVSTVLESRPQHYSNESTRSWPMSTLGVSYASFSVRYVVYSECCSALLQSLFVLVPASWMEYCVTS